MVSVGDSAMRSEVVVADAPLLDQDLCVAQAVEDFAAERFGQEPCVEAFKGAIFSG